MKIAACTDASNTNQTYTSTYVPCRHCSSSSKPFTNNRIYRTGTSIVNSKLSPFELPSLLPRPLLARRLLVMSESLDSIPLERREHPLSVHGVVLFPAAPGASVIHVDAAEYVEWLRERVTTLKSQLALCRASLPAELQSAIDALNIGEGHLAPPSTITPVSSGRETVDRTPIPSAFVPIEIAPDRPTNVFKPFNDDTPPEPSPRVTSKKIPFLKRMFDRSSSGKVFPPEDSSPDRPRMSIAEEEDAPKRTRRRRSLSLDNFGGARRDSRSRVSISSQRRGSFGVDNNGVFRVAYPVPQRAQSAHGKPVVIQQSSPEFNHQQYTTSEQDVAEYGDSLSELENVDDDRYYSGEEVVESDSDCGSIDPRIAANASCGPRDFEPYADESIDSMSEHDLLQPESIGKKHKFRALSDGAALTQIRKSGERTRQPQTVRKAVSPFQTSSASASVDSTDRTAAAEALAKRTGARISFGGERSTARRSFSMDTHQFPRDQGVVEEHRTKESKFLGLGAGLIRSRPSVSMNERERPNTDRERLVNNAFGLSSDAGVVGRDSGFGFARGGRRISLVGGREPGINNNRRMDSAIKRLTRRRPSMTRVVSHPDNITTIGDESDALSDDMKRSASGNAPQQQHFPGRISIGSKAGLKDIAGQSRKLKLGALFRRKQADI